MGVPTGDALAKDWTDLVDADHLMSNSFLPDHAAVPITLSGARIMEARTTALWWTLLTGLLALPPTFAALNDTGQSLCYDGGTIAPCSTATTGDETPYPRQDGQCGRDAQAQAGQLTKTGCSGARKLRAKSTKTRFSQVSLCEKRVSRCAIQMTASSHILLNIQQG